MASPYHEPSWAVAPKENCWTLVEVKGGVEVATHRLNKACTLLGRASDKDDIALAHESCSRFHARIAFDGRGIPWLRDLASAHGTTVNRKKLPPAAIGKVESVSSKTGSRGVVLYPGDVMQFGASTRVYCLEGPPEYDRGGAAEIVKAVHLATTTTTTTTQAAEKAVSAPATVDNKDEGGISWGMDMDDDPNHESTSEEKRLLPAQLDSFAIPEKHRKAWERLTAKRYKLQNVQLENERIRAKGEELSHGQELQLQKNDERLKQWLEEIEEMEKELQDKLFPDKEREEGKKRHHPLSQVVEDDDADDYVFYDRTTESTDDLLFEKGETQASLTIKWKSFRTEWKQCSETLTHEEQTVDQLVQRIQASDPSDEDTFFLQNDLDLAKDSLKRTQQKHESILHNWKETERLLRIVNDKLEMDRETGLIGDVKVAPEMAPPPPPQASMPPPPRMSSSPDTSMPPPPRFNRAPSPEASSLPPPPRLVSSPEASSMPPPPRLAPPVSDVMVPPPFKRKRVLGPTVPPCTFVSGTDNMPPPRAAKRTTAAAPVGTLSVLTSSEKVAKRKEVETKSNESSDPRKDVWKAPAGQDGSGMTKLNAKFAGRY